MLKSQRKSKHRRENQEATVKGAGLKKGAVFSLRSTPQAAVVLFAVALGVRLWYLFESSDNPIFSMPIIDSEVYDEAARELASSGRIGDAFFYQACFYPFFLSLAYWLNDSSMVFAQS